MQRSCIFCLQIPALFMLICAAEAFASPLPRPNATTDQQAKPQKGEAYQFEKVKEWCTAAIKHEPGKTDFTIQWETSSIRQKIETATGFIHTFWRPKQHRTIVTTSRSCSLFPDG